MKFIRDIFDKQKHHFHKGGKLEKFYYIFEGFETFVFSPNQTTASRGVQIRDSVDMKRFMFTVVVAMVPCLLFGMWNAGHQHFLATGEQAEFIDKFLLGLKLVLPILIVSYAVGLGIEFTFTIFTRHPVNEGFLVSGMLIPLILPVTIPLWQVGLATAFAVIIGKEVFGGTGMNVLNVAMTARAFLYFAYPAQMSGEIWTYIGGKAVVDGYSGATPLAIAAAASSDEVPREVVASFANFWDQGLYSIENLFMGAFPGSIGETSTLMCLIGAAILVLTGVGSGRIIFSVFLGAYLTGLLLNALAVNTFMAMPAHYHLILGGLAFGAVFMATDPVTATHTNKGKWLYGILIGVLTVLIRVFNPAYPEGIMMAVLFMNVMAPLIDYYILEANKKRRLKRATV